MPVPTRGIAGNAYRKQKNIYAGEERQFYGEADAYRAALEKAAYGDMSSQYSQGLSGITRSMAGAGPLADGGAPAALRYKLYSGLVDKTRSRVGSGYAEYLAQALAARRNFRYQQALLKLQKKQQSTGFGGVVGGLAGAAVGSLAGGFGAAAGGNLGSKVF